MNIEDFRKEGYKIIDWIAEYYKNIEAFPVKSLVKPGETQKKLSKMPPEKPEEFSKIFKDFEELILPGITHWQSPSFFAYFNANTSFPSILAEFLTAALGTQCMSWQTSPAATELEERVMDWLRELIGLPEMFTGVIQDAASTATLCSVLTARELKSDFKINNNGFGQQKFTLYCSNQAHSSIDKAARISGIGIKNLRKIETDCNYSMVSEKLDEAIAKDINEGFIPLAVIAAIGTTGSAAIDPLPEISKICKKYEIWLHIDAAYAGTALILRENRWMIKTIEDADTFVFNPHKWMFTNFDCSAYFVKDKKALIKTFSILPEYLKTKEEKQVNNYRDWGIQLGRRFRALKLWFVIKSFGAEGLKQKIKLHLKWAGKLGLIIQDNPLFELVTPLSLGVICFRFKPDKVKEKKINKINKQLMETINSTGKIYLTHTKLNGKFTLRFVIGQTYQTWRHILNGWNLIVKMAEKI